MRGIYETGIGVIACILAAMINGCVEEKAFGTGSVEYISSDGSAFERFTSDGEPKNILSWESGNVPPKDRATAIATGPSYFETSGASMEGCSDKQFRCAFGLYRVFAVPRQGFSDPKSYSAGGARFHVEQCLKERNNKCDVALVRSQCESLMAPNRCVSATDSSSRELESAPVVYFIYKDGVGITEYGYLENNPGKDALHVAHQFLLKSKRGLLGEGGFFTSGIDRPCCLLHIRSQ